MSGSQDPNQQRYPDMGDEFADFNATGADMGAMTQGWASLAPDLLRRSNSLFQTNGTILQQQPSQQQLTASQTEQQQQQPQIGGGINPGHITQFIPGSTTASIIQPNQNQSTTTQQNPQQQPTPYYAAPFNNVQMAMASDEYNRGNSNNNKKRVLLQQQQQQQIPTQQQMDTGEMAMMNTPAAVFVKTESGNARPSVTFAMQAQEQGEQTNTASIAAAANPERQATRLLVSLSNSLEQQKQAIASMKTIQRQALTSKDIPMYEKLAAQQTEINALFDNMEQQIADLERNQILVPPELMMISNMEQDLFIQHEQLRLYMAELQHRSANSSPMPCIASLVITEQPFPLVLTKGKQIDEFPVCVRILQGAVQQYRQVDHFTPALVSDPQSKAPSQNIIEMEKEDADGENTKVKLKVINGTRKLPVNMKMTTTVQYPEGTAVLESQTSKPFIVITNECQYEESDGFLLKRMSLGTGPETNWIAFANQLQRHFMRATRQDFLNPDRYLSLHELEYLHERFFAGRATIAAAQFDAFWGWFGKALQKLRYTRHICGLWRQGLVWGFVERDEMVRLLAAQQPGTCVVRFSERHAGLFAVGYKVPQELPTDTPESCVRHYLIKPEEISTQKTLADFLGEVRSFSALVQVKYHDLEHDFDPRANPINSLPPPTFCIFPKDTALAAFYSKREQRNLQGYDVVLGPGPLSHSSGSSYPTVMPGTGIGAGRGITAPSSPSSGPFTPQERPL